MAPKYILILNLEIYYAHLIIYEKSTAIHFSVSFDFPWF
jgi:hypothetical protein